MEKSIIEAIAESGNIPNDPKVNKIFCDQWKDMSLIYYMKKGRKELENDIASVRENGITSNSTHMLEILAMYEKKMIALVPKFANIADEKKLIDDTIELLFTDKETGIITILYFENEYWMYRDNKWSEMTKLDIASVQTQICDIVYGTSSSQRQQNLGHVKERFNHHINTSSIMFLKDKKMPCFLNSNKSSLGKIKISNGIIDIEEAARTIAGGGIYQIEQHTPDLFTKASLTHLNYDPTYDCPIWKMNISKMIENRDTNKILQMISGLMLMPNINPKSIYHIYGKPDTGKSAYIYALHSIFTNILSSSVKLNDLKNQFTSSSMAGKYVNIGDEDSINHKTEKSVIELLKDITSGKKSNWQTVEEKFKGKQEIEFYAKLLTASNEKSIMNEETSAFERRLRIIPFPKVIPMEEKDGDIYHKIDSEINGILNWMIEGAVMWIKGNYVDVPESHEMFEIKDMWFHSENPKENTISNIFVITGDEKDKIKVSDAVKIYNDNYNLLTGHGGDENRGKTSGTTLVNHMRKMYPKANILLKNVKWNNIQIYTIVGVRLRNEQDTTFTNIPKIKELWENI